MTDPDLTDKDLTDKDLGTAKGLVSQRSVALAVSATLLAAGIALALTNYRLGIKWTSDGPDSGYFPFIASLLLCAAALVGLIDGWRIDRRKPFVQHAEFARVMRVLVPTLLFVAVALTLGIYVAAALFVAGFMRFIGASGLAASIATASIFSLVLFWVFEIQFLVPLPKGPIEAMLGF